MKFEISFKDEDGYGKAIKEADAMASTPAGALKGMVNGSCVFEFAAGEWISWGAASEEEEESEIEKPAS